MVSDAPISGSLKMASVFVLQRRCRQAGTAHTRAIDHGNAQKKAERMREIRTKTAIAIPITPKRVLVISLLLLTHPIVAVGWACFVGDRVPADTGSFSDFTQVSSQVHFVRPRQLPERVHRDLS